MLNELKSRGVRDILVMSIDGLTDFNEAITSVFPNTDVQKCVVHQVRNSTKLVNWKDMKAFTSDMKLIYRSPDETSALMQLDGMEERSGAPSTLTPLSHSEPIGRNFDVLPVSP